MPMSIDNMTIVLQERCAGADTVSLVARILHRSKAHLQSMLLQNNPAIVDDFYVHLVCFFVIIYWSIVSAIMVWDLTKLMLTQ